MKRITITLIAVALLVGLGASQVAPQKYINFIKEWGRTQYYTKITQEDIKDPKRELWAYTYTVPTFDANGTERALTFTADKSLRLQAYLRIYASNDGTVVRWEEVQANELPSKVRERLH